MTAGVRAETADGVTTLTLDRYVKRNALSRDALAQLRVALTEAAAEGVHAIILTGAHGCFSAGADFSGLNGTADDAAFDDALNGVIEAIQDGPFLAIAAVAGPCVGAGLDLACACDMRIASTSSFFELPSVRLGLLYNPASLARLHRRLPNATLRRLLLFGQRIQGRDAVAAAIAAQVVDDEQMLEIAQEHARRAIATPRALIETKRFLAALESGATDLAPWQSRAAELLRSSERHAALRRTKSQLQS